MLRNIRRIEDERARIARYQPSVVGAKFFNNRQYHADFEWLILSYLTRALRNAGWKDPEFAEKLPPPQPDFQTYLAPDTPYWRIETSEVLPPDYRRGDFLFRNARNGKKPYITPSPRPEPWSSYYQLFRTKLPKLYAAQSSLVIYDDMTASDFPGHVPWHEQLFERLKTWTYDSATTCDLTRSQYQNIFVVDASGLDAVRLYPHWDVIRSRCSDRVSKILLNGHANSESLAREAV
ncbi:MAG: hypothetical protein ABR611_03555 [Chthoniobacterales bacterium]